MGWTAVNALSLDILGPAFLAGLIILAAHVPLGAVVLNRGIIFIDITLAQVAAVGVVLGSTISGAVDGWVVQISAIAASLGCAMVLTWTDKRFHAVQEAIIGVVYIVAAAIQIVLLSYSSNGAEYLKDLLVGQILLVSPIQLLVIGLIYAAVIGVWYFRDLTNERLLFYGVLAIVITASVQIVGVLLVFASLIIPVLATQQAPARWRLVIAFNIGAAGYLAGLIASAILDISSGAAIVCTLAIIAVAAAKLVSRQPKSAEARQRSRVRALQDEIQTRLTKTGVA